LKSNKFPKKSTIKSPFVAPVKKILRSHHLFSVCESAHCPNIGECFRKKTATFLIMGSVCTRNCRFCNIGETKNPQPLDKKEPQNLADAVFELGLRYVVVTSVTRDDLPDGGANHFVKVIKAIREKDKNIKIEVLTPDFKGNKEALQMEAEAPAYCKERRSNCKAHCFGNEDCLFECSNAFVQCYEDYKERNK